MSFENRDNFLFRNYTYKYISQKRCKTSALKITKMLKEFREELVRCPHFIDEEIEAMRAQGSRLCIINIRVTLRAARLGCTKLPLW